MDPSRYTHVILDRDSGEPIGAIRDVDETPDGSIFGIVRHFLPTSRRPTSGSTGSRSSAWSTPQRTFATTLLGCSSNRSMYDGA